MVCSFLSANSIERETSLHVHEIIHPFDRQFRGSHFDGRGDAQSCFEILRR